MVIHKPEDLPENSIVLAHDKSLNKLIETRDKLESYLNIVFSHNPPSGYYKLHIIYEHTLCMSKIETKPKIEEAEDE